MKKLIVCIAALLVQVAVITASAQAVWEAQATDESLFRFIVNRGDVFSPVAPGELTELSLSGYFCMNDRWQGQITPAKSANSVTLTGKATINAYSKHLQTNIVASLSMPAIASPTGLFLTLIVDGTPMTIQLPYVNENDNWPVGYEYTYNITVEGRGLTISGVTYSPLQATTNN